MVTLHGITANLYGSVEEFRHDSGMVVDSGLLQQFEHSYNLYQEPMRFFGNPPFPLHVHLQ